MVCKITFVGGTPRRVEVTATDAGSGLASIEVTTAVNIVVPVTITPSNWSVATTSRAVITAIKDDQTKPAQVATSCPTARATAPPVTPSSWVRFDPVTLTDGQVVRIDVARAMRPGDDNTFAFTTAGKPGGTAGMLIHD